jgi:hypothetical protein
VDDWQAAGREEAHCQAKGHVVPVSGNVFFYVQYDLIVVYI